MTQEVKERIDTEEEREEKRLSTADVAQAIGRPHEERLIRKRMRPHYWLLTNLRTSVPDGTRSKRAL